MADAAVDLPARYYLHNFQALCDAVWLQYEDLLTDEEATFYRDFSALDESSRCLLVRLLSRRGPLFRVPELKYEELGCLDGCVTELFDQGMIINVEPDLEELFRLYRKNELQTMFSDYPAAASSKAALLERLQASDVSAAELAARRCQSNGDVIVGLAHSAVLTVFQLLFFGNSRQSLTDFVLGDLGVARYYPYQLARDERSFSRREEVDEYLHLLYLRDAYYQALEAEDTQVLLRLAQELPEQGSSELLQSRLDKLCNTLGRQLEREGELVASLQVYERSVSHPARERQVRVLQVLEDARSALTLTEQMIESPWNEAELDFAQRQKPRLLKLLGHPPVPLRRPSFKETVLTLETTDARVELAAAECLREDWESVHYVENSVFTALFGLAFWDVIFTSVRGAFVNPFQHAPVDMFSGAFYARRSALIEQRINDLQTAPSLCDELQRVYLDQYGYSNAWVSWQYPHWDVLEQALLAVPWPHLEAIWRRMLFDPQANRSGFPDLMAFGDAQRYSLIEVKGPGDQLQLNQKRWLRFFSEHEIPWQVVRVEWDR